MYTLNIGFFFEIGGEIAEDSIASLNIQQWLTKTTPTAPAFASEWNQSESNTRRRQNRHRQGCSRPSGILAEIKIVRDAEATIAFAFRRRPPTVSQPRSPTSLCRTKPMPLPKDSRGVPYAVGMEGHWTITRIEADGEALADETTNKFGKTLRCTGGWLVTPGRGLFDLGWDMHFELDTTTSPKRITLRAMAADGPLRFNGIYLLDGTDLTICVNENGQDPRVPKDFKTTKESPFVLFTCKWSGV